MKSNAISQRDFTQSTFYFEDRITEIIISMFRIYPTQQTASDRAFMARVQTLEWVDFDFLEIPEKNRCREMWEYAAKSNHISSHLYIFST